jgi:hypothetical protein
VPMNAEILIDSNSGSFLIFQIPPIKIKIILVFNMDNWTEIETQSLFLYLKTNANNKQMTLPLMISRNCPELKNKTVDQIRNKIHNSSNALVSLGIKQEAKPLVENFNLPTGRYVQVVGGQGTQSVAETYQPQILVDKIEDQEYLNKLIFLEKQQN